MKQLRKQFSKILNRDGRRDQGGSSPSIREPSISSTGIDITSIHGEDTGHAHGPSPQSVSLNPPLPVVPEHYGAPQPSIMPTLARQQSPGAIGRGRNDYTLVARHELTMENPVRGSSTFDIENETEVRGPTGVDIPRRLNVDKTVRMEGGIHALPGARNLKMQNVALNIAGGNIEKNIHYHSSGIKGALTRIPEPVGMSWNPARVCLPGTRTPVLKKISSWLYQSPIGHSVPARVFLIADAAGSGKSAIAHSVSHMAHDSGILVSSFFFDRLNREQSTTQYLLGSIIRGLCRLSPQAHNLAADLLEKDDSYAIAAPTLQFNMLVLPMAHLLPHDQPVVIVIDGLDEGFDLDLIKILREHVQHLPFNFRILLTTRPEERIMQHLQYRWHIKQCDISLTGHSSQLDIEKYVHHELQESSPHLSIPIELRNALIEKSEGVFLWTATVLNHVKHSFDPVDELKSVLKSNSAYWVSNKNAGQKLDDLYAKILSKLEWDDDNFVKAYTTVVGAIVVAKEPLSPACLACLYAHQGITIRSILKVAMCIQPLLDGFNKAHPRCNDVPIRLLHLSVKEYLTDRAPFPYNINQNHHHFMLSMAALIIIDQDLTSANVPLLGYTEHVWNKHHLPPIPSLKKSELPLQLWYSCTFLLEHVLCLLDLKKNEHAEQCLSLLEQVLLQKSCHLLEITASIGSVMDLAALRIWRIMAIEQLSLHHLTVVNQKIDATIAESLHLISLWLSSDSVWRLPEAVIAAMNSTEISRQLAKQDPTLYRLQLGKALNVASIALFKRDGSASLYGTSSGLKLSIEAAQIFQDLGKSCFVTLFQEADSSQYDTEATFAIQSHLADSLLIQSYHTQDLETKASILGEAIKINRWLTSRKPHSISYKAGLAVCLEHYAELLISQLVEERSHKARETLKEVVEAQYWCFANDQSFSDLPPASLTKYMNDPQNAASSILENAVYTLCKNAARQGVKLDGMAQSILFCNISRRLQRQRNYSAAQRAIEEAIAITSDVCNKSPEVLYINEHQELLAYFLYKLFVFICYKKEYTGARAVLEESIKIRNQLCLAQKYFAFEAEGDPFMQSPPKSFDHKKILADSWYILWCFSAKHDRHKRARDALINSIALFHEIVMGSPAESKVPLAALLHELSVELYAEGSHSEAIEYINEAISIYRSSVSEASDVSYLVVPLQHLFLYHSEEQNYEAANKALAESLEIDGGAFDDLSIHEASTAQSLTILAQTLEAQGCYDDALNAMEEVIQILRLLSSSQPCNLSHKLSLAASLHNLAICQLQHIEGVSIAEAEVEGCAKLNIKEAVNLVQEVASEQMTAVRYRPPLEMPEELREDLEITTGKKRAAFL